MLCYSNSLLKIGEPLRGVGRCRSGYELGLYTRVLLLVLPAVFGDTNQEYGKMLVQISVPAQDQYVGARNKQLHWQNEWSPWCMLTTI